MRALLRSPWRRAALLALGAALLLPLLPACGGGLPDPTLIDRVRVLAVRVEPPELRGTQPMTAQLEVLAVAPRDVRIAGQRWYRCADWDLNANSFLCPFNGGTSEALGSGPTLSYTVDPEALLDLARAQVAALAPGRSEEIDLLLQMIGLWDTVNVTVTGDDGARVEATKRLVVSGPLAGQAAWMLPDAAGAERSCRELGADVPPNTNPTLTELRYPRAEGAPAPVGGPLDAAGSVRLPAGEKIELHPVVDWESLQAYPQLDVLSAAPTCRYAEEIPMVSWACDAGKLADGATASSDRNDPGQLVRLNNFLDLPEGEDIPADGLVRCWAVLRDGRGGTDWQPFAIQVE